MVELLCIGLAVFAYGLVSERLEMSAITAPMAYTTIGLVIGAGGLGLFDLDLEGEAISVLVEATLVLVLFTDAIRIDVSTLRREAAIPARLLGVGLPLTVVAGTGVALIVLPDLNVTTAILLAAVLAPTDAALGQAVVSDRRLPVRLRQALNVESGLNDGIALPLVTAVLAIAVSEQTGDSSNWVTFALEQIGFGVLVGAVVGYVGGKLIDSGVRAGHVDGLYQQLATIAIAVVAFAGAGLLDGNGFIAAFVAGIAFGQSARPHCARLQDFTEDEGELLSTITFVVFGAVLAGPLLDELTWQIALYAVLSLTLVRMLPVLIATAGSKMFLETRLFLGWFGPRGLASILFALLVIEDLDSSDGRLVFKVAVWTVLLSVYAHGATASAWTGRLAARLAAETDPMPETETVDEIPTRRNLQ